MEELLELVYLQEITTDDVESILINELLLFRSEIRVRAHAFGNFNFDELNNEECRQMFRFEKKDLEQLRINLGIPDIVESKQRYRVSGLLGFCICLRRLTYPNRLCDLERIFGLSSPYLSVISNKVISIIVSNHGYLLKHLKNLHWLNESRLKYYANAISNKGTPIHNCWAFIDGTARPICRPTIHQQEYFSGHKRHHCLKYQSVLTPDGIIANLRGPYPGRRHDAGMLRDTELYSELLQIAIHGEKKYIIYGDPAYPMSELILKPYCSKILTPEQVVFNKSMSSVRQAVEWGFGKVIAEFAFLDFKKNQKLLLQEVSNMYMAGVILSNCHTCLYGSQTASYFSTVPPTLEEYLNL